MSLTKWKELADKKAGEMKRNVFDEITVEEIRLKTIDQAIAKTFRLDRLDQIAEQTKPKLRSRVQFRPEINRDEGLDYAPEVDPYEDIDVEGLLNLEDYVAPQAEKQIAKMPSKAPLYEENDPLAIEGPPEEGEEEVEEEGEEEEEEGEYEGEEDLNEANKILDELELPNYDDVEMRLNEPEMTATKQRNYLNYVIKNAEARRRQVIDLKSDATKNSKKVKSVKNQKT